MPATAGVAAAAAAFDRDQRSSPRFRKETFSNGSLRTAWERFSLSLFATYLFNFFFFLLFFTLARWCHMLFNYPHEDCPRQKKANNLFLF
jgi:hypothetical protein